MPTATIETIRDRIIALITAIQPTSLTGDRFRVSRDEDMADFRVASESNPPGCLRRFQVDDDGGADNPESTNVDTALQVVTFVVQVAYPNTHRYGAAAGRDRKDVIDEDWRRINYACGIYGRANFSGTNDCTPLGAVKEVEKGEKVTYLVATIRMQYVLDVDG